MHPIDLAAFWPGYDVVACSHSVEKNLTLTLEPRAADLPRCGRCQQPSPLIHDRRIRLVRDRDLFDQRVQLRLPIRRVDCLTCGRVTEHISWLAPASRLTRRLCSWVETLLRFMPISHVSQLTGLHWHTIKTLDKRRLQAAFGTFEPGDVRRLVMDEFALHKGHRYATVIMDAERTRVLWVGLGNSRKAIRPFFEQLGERCQQIEAVAMDMNTAFDLEVKQHCPQAEVVYDLFHVVARYGRDVIDRIRVDQANALRHDKPARQVVKQSRWLLLRNRENLKEDHAVRLQELLAANQPLATVYVLKDALKEVWYAPSVREGWRRWRTWLRHVRESGLAPLQRFARNLQRYARGILASARFHMHTSLLEGVNNRIKVIKRMAYGFRDADYFFLKIKAAFPGKMR
ncbi:ISL3 family transposase [Pseudomonas sp. AN-1]|uniref:ISL3 family transposase n=1 Tax=Pseudomonas sp. AN-1 TaxID=3096605 RepID=UPI002A69C533|nr:ISL3 family transposase [Pseudomonas sp. AN-1]WPP44060.1 ISL3 family transposase [Pseudomonas sp. AN-1]WPP45128.1 ISL3 family transposase [Pseudomonas sp. AN-1]WPP45290.1 ISL3 family transposase [Pseudomonas sp. AN-1]WPP45402.1 ISL3 family transposase [Pseudomonas sp. AN-1]WPP45698.1 ISL3 family transposase [Pseudomonas sp. AN-1]